MIFNFVPWVREKETIKFLKKKFSIAAKEHGCCECDDTIFPGDKYQYSVGLEEGNFLTFKTCEACAGLRTKFDARYMYLFDDVWKIIENLDTNNKRFNDIIEEELSFIELEKLAKICIEKNWEEIRSDALWLTY